MKMLGIMRQFGVVLLLTLIVTGTVDAQWDKAALEQISSGPDYDMPGRHSMVLDKQGTLHVVYSGKEGALPSHLFYATRTARGEWTTPEPLGDHAYSQGMLYWIELGPQQKKPYVIFSQDGMLTLGIRANGQWQFHSLETPFDWPYQNPSLAVDAAGNAHVAMVFHNPTGSMHHIGYGYWDGTSDFHCQIFTDMTALEDAGLWGQPVIVANPDGSVVMTYRSLHKLASVELVIARNSVLGGTVWTEEVVTVPNGQPGFTGDLIRLDNGDLHCTFTTNMFWPFAKEVFYLEQPAGARGWTTPVKISEGYYGILPKLAIDKQGKAHVVAQETSGMHSTGNLLYFTNTSGDWTQDYLLQGLWGNATFLLDKQGNGSVLMTDEVDHIDDYDIYYYGFVAKPKQIMTLDPRTPISIKI